MFTLDILFDNFQFTFIHGPNIPCSYAILLFTASEFTSITSHIHNLVLFSLWLHLFILSRIISPLFSSSILGTCQPGEFIFHCHIFLPFHTVHGVLKARILKWSAIPFSSGPHFVRTLHLTRPSWVGLYGMAHSFIELDKAVVSKITADGDCSHEIKRRLLLGRKVMTNLDSILKSRDITWPKKV